MLCVEDYIERCTGRKSIGGLDALVARADANAAVLDGFVGKSSWLGHLAVEPATRSNTSVCLSFTDPDVAALDADGQAAFAKGLVSVLDKEGVAYDIGAFAMRRQATHLVRCDGRNVGSRSTAALARLGLCRAEGIAESSGLRSFAAAFGPPIPNGSKSHFEGGRHGAPRSRLG